MTQKEIELKMFRLNAEYTKRSHEIGRKKQDVAMRRQEDMLHADDVFHAEKRLMIDRIGSLRKEKAALFDGDPKKDRLEAEARAIEADISMLRCENDRRKRAISHKAYIGRCALDEESRQLAEWLQAEKPKVMEQEQACPRIIEDRDHNPYPEE